MDPRSKYQSFLIQYHAGVARDLPAISPFARDLARQPRTDIPSLGQLVRAFTTDPFLAAKVTGASNSVFFAHDHFTVLTVPEAIKRVGLRYAMNLLWAAPPVAAGVEEAELAALWAHCMSVAHVAKRIAAGISAPPVDPDVAHLVALIHDIGYLLQLSYSPHMRNDIDARLERGEDADNEPHASQGGELARFWSLPLPVVSAVRTHHDPNQSTDWRGRWLSTVVAASEALLHRSPDPKRHMPGLGGADTLVAQLDVPTEQLLQLRAEALSLHDECLRIAARGTSTRHAPQLHLIRTGGGDG